MFSSTTSMRDRLYGFWEWVRSGQAVIKDRRGALAAWKPNAMQVAIFSRCLAQANSGLPIRIVGLKPRKVGFSTFVQALFFFLTRNTPQCSARVIAHTRDATRDIFEISERLAKNARRADLKMKIGGSEIRFAHDSALTLRTAGGENVSSGATINCLHLSELAKWPGTREAVKGQLASVMQSVPTEPESIVFVESTANMIDTSGLFKAMWNAAQADDNPYEPFFFPWFEEASYSIPGARLRAEEKTEYEKKLQDKCGVTDAQLAWRRAKINGDFAGDERYYLQEFPATAEEAFQAPAGLIFPMLSEEKHARCIPPDQLAQRGYTLYRGVDWGGADPFACVWVAHRPGLPAFSVDRHACPHTWRELAGYYWDAGGRPVDLDDHTLDALRYAISFFSMRGHVHVYRELYLEDSAGHNLSPVDQAILVRNATSPTEEIAGTVCDRSQPGNINLFNQQRVSSCAYAPPDRTGTYGEKVDGLMRMQALMIGSAPLFYDPAPQTWEQDYLARKRRRALPAGVSSHEMMIALTEAQGRGAADNPWMGRCT